MDNAIQLVFQILILLFSVVIHEVSHGYAALMLGDRTAESEGRLTLNPIKHLDLFGSIILPVLFYFSGGFIFGWAKPVPYNPYNLRNQKWGPAIVGAAGPAANILLAVVFGIFIRFSPVLFAGPAQSYASNFLSIASTVVLLNLVLAIFNFVPIPPLDGSKVLFALLPYRWQKAEYFLEQYGLFLLFFFIFFLSRWLLPFALLLFKLITGTFPFF